MSLPTCNKCLKPVVRVLSEFGWTVDCDPEMVNFMDETGVVRRGRVVHSERCLPLKPKRGSPGKPLAARRLATASPEDTKEKAATP